VKQAVFVLLALALAGCGPQACGPPKDASGTFIAIYRWRIRPGCEEQFRAAWHAETIAFRDTWGSYGTRLSRADDGTWVAVAFWPTRARWLAAHRQALELPTAEATLADCVLSKEQELHLESVEDLTAFPRG
jgi:heme-degrading monooxygenase HmoA